MLLIELFGKKPTHADKHVGKLSVPDKGEGGKNADDPLAKRNILKGYDKFKDTWGSQFNANHALLAKKLMRNVPLQHHNVVLPEEEELNEEGGFRWSSQWDEQTFISLQGLVKHNNGVYKSAKQAAFLGNQERWGDKARTDDGLQKYFGITLDKAKGELFAIAVDGYMQFANYGKKGLRPITYFFVFDKYGVCKKYQLHFVGDMRQGTHPDPKKTELKWARPEGVDTSALDADVQKAADIEANPPPSTSKHIGQVGERLTFDLITKALIDKGIGEWGQMWLNVFETPDGSVVMYNGYMSKDKGEQLKVKATVKKHVVGKDGNPITVISRPKKLSP